MTYIPYILKRKYFYGKIEILIYICICTYRDFVPYNVNDKSNRREKFLVFGMNHEQTCCAMVLFSASKIDEAKSVKVFPTVG